MSLIKFEIMWVLTREPLEKDSEKWREMKAKTDALIKEILPEFDLARLFATV